MTTNSNHPIKGGHLVYTLVCEANRYWRLDYGLPLERTEQHRHEPFADILFAVEPSLSAEVVTTADDIGVAYLWTLSHVLQIAPWVSRLKTSLRKGEVPWQDHFASITMSHAPVLGATDVMSTLGSNFYASNTTDGIVVRSGALSAKGHLLTAPAVPIKDKVWLYCFTQIFISAFR